MAVPTAPSGAGQSSGTAVGGPPGSFVAAAFGRLRASDVFTFAVEVGRADMYMLNLEFIKT